MTFKLPSSPVLFDSLHDCLYCCCRYEVAFIMAEPGTNPGQSWGTRATYQANVHIHILDEDCSGNPVVYPPFVNITTGGELFLRVPCPANFSDRNALHYDLPIEIDAGGNPDASINGAEVVLDPGYPLFNLAIHNTSNATWTLLNPLLNEWVCTATNYTSPAMEEMIERRRLTVPGEPIDPVTANLLAYGKSSRSSLIPSRPACSPVTSLRTPRGRHDDDVAKQTARYILTLT